MTRSPIRHDGSRVTRRSKDRRRLTTFAVLLLIALLVLPAWASLRLARSFDPRFIFGYALVVSSVTFWLYWHDKRRAEADGWRTPESTLHLAEFLGGWPAAFLAQRTLRHKISKTRYQVTFWAIVTAHEAASFDFLAGWYYTKAAIGLFHS